MVLAFVHSASFLVNVLLTPRDSIASIITKIGSESTIDNSGIQWIAKANETADVRCE